MKQITWWCRRCQEDLHYVRLLHPRTASWRTACPKCGGAVASSLPPGQPIAAS